MFSSRLPTESLFSHSTAARLIGIPVPWWSERDARLHVSVAAPRRAPHAAGIIGHRSRLTERDGVVMRGVRVTSPVRTWLDLASMVRFADLVAAGDYIIHWRLPLAERDELSRAVESFGRARGAINLRKALPLLSDRAESPPESELRVILAVAGLPSPDINHALVDTDTGRHLRPDFTFREHRVILEYQGDYHRTREQWRKDMTRRSKLEAEGWYVMEINADDLRSPEELVARVRTVLARRR
ncbi:DUF559 domain-containing protein [Glaciihabitans arcticus]|uniref:DUF559 domain-containing protein n=1 Tax=Glaciihabitans arcticus TaxID=2668039 RepID=UPI001386E590|nr:DUF559 domain-containing protein [Glaciihabitans arcticus]